MARLRGDKGDYSDWNASGVRTRDARHSHDGPETVTKPGKKNTRKWCKGIVGREHKLEAFLMKEAIPFLSRIVRCCKQCGKDFGTYRGGKRPDWVTAGLMSELQREKSKKWQFGK